MINFFLFCSLGLQTFRHIATPERTTAKHSRSQVDLNNNAINENPEYILPHDPPIYPPIYVPNWPSLSQVDLNNNAINENPEFILPHDPPIYIPNWPSHSQVDLNNNVINPESEPINIVNIPNPLPTHQYILPHDPRLLTESPIHTLNSALEEKNNDLKDGELYGQWNQVTLNHARYYLRKKYLHPSDNM